MTEPITQEEIIIQIDQQETAERCWRRVSYVLAFITMALVIIALAGFATQSIPVNIVAMLGTLAGFIGWFAWGCARRELTHIQNQRVLDWDYFNSNTEDEEELHELQSDVWDLKRQIQEKNQMIRQLTAPEQTVRVRSITALTLLPR